MTKSSVTKYWLVPVPKELKHIAEKMKVPIRDVRNAETSTYSSSAGGYSIEHSESQLWVSAEDLRAVKTMAAVLETGASEARCLMGHHDWFYDKDNSANDVCFICGASRQEVQSP